MTGVYGTGFNQFISCKKYNLGEIVKHFLEQMELKNNTLIFL